MPLSFEKYRIRDGDSATAESINAIHRDLDLRLAAIEDINTGIEAIRQELTAFGVQQVSDALQPTLDSVEAQVLATQTQLQDAIDQANALVAQAQAAVDALQGSDLSIPGTLTIGDGAAITGDVVATGEVTGSNLSGTNTGDEAAATTGTLGLVRVDNDSGGSPLVYVKASVDSLVAGLQSQIDALEAQYTEVEELILESLGAYGAERKTGTSAHNAPSPGYWVGIIAQTDAVVSAYSGISNFAALTLKAGDRLIVRTSSFQLSSGEVIAIKGAT